LPGRCRDSDKTAEDALGKAERLTKANEEQAEELRRTREIAESARSATQGCAFRVKAVEVRPKAPMSSCDWPMTGSRPLSADH
jgi:hypothetical protein